MRHLSLSTRLTLALFGAALLLLGAGGAWQVLAERADLDRAVERELRLLGRSLQVAFENALRDRQSEDVEETLRALERIDPSVDILVFDAERRHVASSVGADVRAVQARLASPAPDYHADTQVAELRLPLEIPSRPAATMVLVRPLADIRHDLRATRERITWSIAAYVLVLLGVTMLATRSWVGAPLARMIAHIRRVRVGDLSPSTGAPTRRDEIGQTVIEFERLVADLAEARARLEEETEARRRFELATREMDKLATIGQLAAGLAHEIGSPLQVLEGRLATLESRADDPDETRRLAQIAREQSARITRIVARLTNVARRATNVSWIEPAPPVRAVVALLEAEVRRRKIRLELEVAPDLPRMRGDADSIQQIALNLVRNAIDATPPDGSVVVRLSSRARTRDGVTSPVIALEVRDTGRGMSEEDRARAFEPFFTTRAEGTGLGLAVVRGIVDEHLGDVTLESTLGVGTHVTVLLPCDGGDGGADG